MNAWANHPEEFSHEIVPILEEVASDRGRGEAEAFLRSSTLRRVDLGLPGDEIAMRVGREQGAALRWFDPREGTSGFAAASGAPSSALERCRLIAETTPGRPVGGCPWNSDPGSGDDLDPVALPEEEELADWIRSTAPQGLEWAWVETGIVSEAWATHRGSLQKRRRSRAWAAWMPRKSGAGSATPMFLAARTWSLLRRADPDRPWSEREVGPGPDRCWPDDAQMVFSPETSSKLVQLVARATHHPGVEPGKPVGPGWVLRSGGADTLFGSRCDDAGFAVRAETLADGHRVIAAVEGPGHLRRPSFRDPPEPTPVSLVLEPPRVDPPKRAVWVARADVYPAGEHWLLELHGRRYPDGAGFPSRWARIRPRDLLEGCLGGLGPARESHTGVTTPALVFDGLWANPV